MEKKQLHHSCSFAQWLKWIKEGYTILPYIETYPLKHGSDRIADWSGVWAEAEAERFVLESGKDGRYTILGISPVSKIQGKGNNVEVYSQRELAESVDDERPLVMEEWDAKPLEAIKRWMAPYHAPYVDGAPKFTGGCVGYMSYDVARSIEKLPTLAADDLNLPDYVFLRFNELWIIDHQEELLHCSWMTELSLSKQDGAIVSEQEVSQLHQQAIECVRGMNERWQRWYKHVQTPEAMQRLEKRKQLLQAGMMIDVEAFEGVRTAFSKEDFMQAVRQIQAYIAAGDVFQVNLSMRQMKELHVSAEQLYEWLRLVNPSPYMGLLHFDGFQLVSSSPELLVKLEKGEVSARPIAGTRRRGKTEAEDLQMAEELRSNEKEQAEHIMLVDLERNDLGRISSFGSVRVDELMVIEYYSHVMHLVSNVRGKLAAGKDAYDVIRAKFPGGTITGAPKVRTMEIIEELEPVRRGPYTGSFGWIDYTGDMELNIIIRTLTLKDGIGHIQAGAGIVIDSEPEREYRESLNKAKALWKAVQLSEREGSID